tara:strand:- start:428 stop:3040 length:2613 start_codon:yes stop_codon:yes gene_type:complete
MSSIREYAFLANAVYSAPDRQKSLDSITTASGGAFNGSDYTILEGDSDYFIFRRKSDGDVIVACRGTRDLTDAIPDTFIALGLLRFHKRSKKILAAVDRYKYLGMRVSITGHSLGGKLAALVGASEGVLAVTFNQGASPVDSNPVVAGIQKEFLGYNYNNVIHVTTAFDGVSTTEAIAQTNRTVIIKAPSFNPLTNHGLSAFFNMDEEDTKKGDNVFKKENDRVRKEQDEAPLIDNVAHQMTNARAYAGNSLNVFRLHRDYFKTIFSSDQMYAMDELAAAPSSSARAQVREMLEIAFDDAELSGDYQMKGEDDYMTDAKLDKLIRDEDVRVARAKKQQAGDEYDADLDGFEASDEKALSDAGKGDEFDEDLGEGLTGADRDAFMSEDEFIEDLGMGVADAGTATAKLNVFERNIKNMEGIPAEVKTMLLGKVAELRAANTVAGILERVGLYKVAAGVRAISVKLGVKWTALLAKDVSMFGGRVVINVGTFLKKLTKFLDVVMIVTQAFFLASEIYDLVILGEEIKKLKDSVNIPEFKFLRFKMKMAIDRMQFLLDSGDVKAAVHGIELAVGVFLTVFPGTQGFAALWWGGVAVEQLAEIPADYIMGLQLKADFVSRWYGTPASFSTYVKFRDYDALENGEAGDIGNYLRWVGNDLNLNLSVNRTPRDILPKLLEFAADLKKEVDVIVNDPRVEEGLADNRYERLTQVSADIPASIWGAAMLTLHRMAGVYPPITTIGDVIQIGLMDFKPRTLQEAWDLNRLVNAQRLKRLSYASHEQSFLSGGNKPRGDNETMDEYTSRMNSWLDTRFGENLIRTGPVGLNWLETRHNDLVKAADQEIPDVVDADFVVCGLRPKPTKRKLQLIQSRDSAS